MDIETKKVILQIVPSMELGGAEAGTLEVSNFMKKMGWKVKKIGRPPPPENYLSNFL